MKLLAVSTWLPYPLDNGSRVRAYHLLRHLSRRHTVTLLSFGVPHTLDNLIELQAFCDVVEVVPPSTIKGNRLRGRGLLSAVPRHFIQTDSQAMRSLLARHLPGHDAAIGMQVDAAWYLRDYPELPRVFEEAEVTILQERYLQERSPLRRWRRRLTWLKSSRFIASLVNSFNQTTVVSAIEREHLGAIGCDLRRVSVVPNGVESARVAPPAVRECRLIYTGSVQYFANLDAVEYFVREIFPLIRRSRSDAIFSVTGSTAGVDVDSLAAVEGVEFTGQLPEVDTLVARSAISVVPLRIGGGTRLKVLQAMALGTPVISTTKGIEGLDMEADQHLLVADTPADFARQTVRLLGDRTLGNRLSTNASRLVRERYAWGPIGEVLERAIEAAVSEHAMATGRTRNPA